ncbi:sodium:proline symporter [Psychrosphaera saromensis]|uniref:Sodium/proline symporter n=1 Tax=Psychrosphaera saromensis TaxID=716813 RepID=A0A2S7UTL5_9GAMM|nr:sodium/proline symporter PutP [Psychrosphaera saromensis]PQJ53283.1 sodium/proline symporter [Psychrosphaera saromensis]GHB66679.1 sodium:proline symporter [Psychrosphaera saromensis]GLQ14950.1 sodium:proline symporter [Psychrosphaera saromensis]
MHYSTYITLGLYFIAMLAIGLYAYRKSTSDLSGYMLGGRSLPPAVAALSAGASDMSGWILMGLPGAMFVSGLSSSWIAFGLFLGALVNYLVVAPRLRVFTEKAKDALTVPDYFAKRFNDQTLTLRLIASTVIIIFFTLYTSSGLVAGGKLFETSFGLDYSVGLIVTAAVVVAYTMFGGFLAVSLTDFVQGCIMFVAVILVPAIAFTQFDGLSEMTSIISAVNPTYFDWFEGLSLIAIVSSMAWGLGYFGQPHIIVRFMALRSVKDMPTMRNIGMGWMFVALVGALAVGFTGVAYVNKFDLGEIDPETIFLVFSNVLFHPLITGFLLAAILAAIMSTISSQLLVSSSSLTDDFYKTFVKRDASDKELVMVGRLSVLLVSVVAGILALDRDSSVLSLVSNAWAGFGAAFGPLIIFSLFWNKMTKQAATAGMIIGAVTVLIWIYAPFTIDGQSLSSWMYEIVPGFICSSIAIYVVTIMNPQQEQEVLELFDEVEQEFK